MGALVVIPRWQQLTQFMEALRTDPPYERRTLFERLTNLTPKEVDDLLYNGLSSIDASTHDWERALADMESLGIESGVRDTLLNLQSRFPCGQDLSVEVFPMDSDDTFGRDKLGASLAGSIGKGPRSLCGLSCRRNTVNAHLNDRSRVSPSLLHDGHEQWP